MPRLFVLNTSLVIFAAPASALDLPTRKAGLWKIKMVFDGCNLPPTVMKQCADAATDKLMNGNFGGSNEQACSKQDHSYAVVSGSFDSAYTIKVASTSAGGPPLPGVAPGAQTHMTIEAKSRRLCRRPEAAGPDIARTISPARSPSLRRSSRGNPNSRR